MKNSAIKRAVHFAINEIALELVGIYGEQNEKKHLVRTAEEKSELSKLSFVKGTFSYFSHRS